jgi:penicillin-binding protein 1A
VSSVHGRSPNTRDGLTVEIALDAPSAAPDRPRHSVTVPPAEASRQPDVRRRRTSGIRRTALDLCALFVGTAAVLAVMALVVDAVVPRLTASAAQIVDAKLLLPTDAALPPVDERSVIVDGDGVVLAVIDRETTRRNLALRNIPSHLQQAVIAAEDRKFYEHDGYDVEGIGRAALANFRAREISEGGSTITQQLAKTHVGHERTLERKSRELLYALALEQRFSKDQLLERYLNYVYFGSRAYGVAAAADEFFHTSVGELKVHQSALLASLIRAPNTADPRTHPRLALRRRNAVLTAMADEGYIQRQRLQRLLARPLTVRPSSPERDVRQPHVVDAVVRELLNTEELGGTRQDRERLLYHGGLRITTTLDRRMQRTATRVIRSHLPYGTPTAAIATVDPATGQIKAIASGLRYRKLKYDLPTQGRRQPGSAFKPFVYAAALQEGFPIDMSLTGRSPAFFEGVPGWDRDCSILEKPTCGVSNYGGASYGRVDMADALRSSVNTAAAQLTVTLGPERVAKLADRMNIDIDAATNGRITASIGLGGLDQGVTPLEMASAYGVFANDGRRVRPHLIAKVEQRSGRVLYEAQRDEQRVLDALVNTAVVDLMRGVVTAGTGTGAQVEGWDVAGKTGTTSNNVDAWFVGYTPVLSTAVWVGHARGQVTMPGMTGGALPATLWREYMAKVLRGRPEKRFDEVDLDALADRMATIEVTIPDVVGLHESDALTTLGDRKLLARVHRVASSMPAGTVVWQTPTAGQTSNAGDDVILGVSDGTPPDSLDFPVYVPPPLFGDDTDG